MHANLLPTWRNAKHAETWLATVENYANQALGSRPIGAPWSEIEGDVWMVPAERMKRGALHRVPLSPQTLEVLAKVRGLDAELVFPSAVAGHRLGGRTRWLRSDVNAFIEGAKTRRKAG